MLSGRRNIQAPKKVIQLIQSISLSPTPPLLLLRVRLITGLGRRCGSLQHRLILARLLTWSIQVAEITKLRDSFLLFTGTHGLVLFGLR